MSFKQVWLFSLLGLALGLLIGFSFWNLLPEQIPMHFDLLGNPTEFASKKSVLLLSPVLNFASLFLINSILLLGLKKEHSADKLIQFQKNIFLLNLSLLVLFLFLQAGIIFPSWRPESFRFDSLFAYGLSLFLGIFGLSLKDLPQNKFIGVRTIWTKNSNENWIATHRFANRVLTGASLLSLILFLAFDEVIICIYFAFISCVLILLFSYRYSRKK